jgi:hypothetical protein
MLTLVRTTISLIEISFEGIPNKHVELLHEMVRLKKLHLLNKAVARNP